MANRNLRQVRIEKSSRNGDSYEDMGPRPQQQLLHPGKNSNNKRPLDMSEGDPSLMPPKMEDGEEEKGLTIDIKSLLKPGEKRYNQRCRLFAGNLPTDITEEDFKKLFDKYGEPNEVYINRDRGFGFIRLESRMLAEIAKAELDGMILKSRPLRIRFASHANSVIVRNLSPVVSNELLGEAFSIFGSVERAVVIVDDRGRTTGKGFVEFDGKHSARKALVRCADGAFILTTTPQPVVVEPMEQFDHEEGLPEKFMNKTQHYLKEREELPRFAQPGTFEFEYSSRWKALFEMEKQQKEQVDRNIKEAKEKLETEMEAARHEHQLMLMRQDLMRRQEELRRLEDLRNQELQKRKQYHMRNEEEVRRREEEFVRQHDPEEIRRQEVFKSGYMDSAPRHVNMDCLTELAAVLRERKSKNVRPVQRVTSDVNSSGAGPSDFSSDGILWPQTFVPKKKVRRRGRRGAGKSKKLADKKMGISEESDQESEGEEPRNDRFAQGSPSQMGSPMVNRSGTEAAQPTMVGGSAVGGSAGPGGFGRGNQGGNFDAANKRRCY